MTFGSKTRLLVPESKSIKNFWDREGVVLPFTAIFDAFSIHGIEGSLGVGEKPTGANVKLPFTFEWSIPPIVISAFPTLSGVNKKPTMAILHF